MRLFKTFFYSLRRSLFDPSYYTDVLKASLGFSFRFFFMFCLLLGLVAATTIGFVVAPTISDFSKKVTKQAYQAYPEDLEITVKDQKLSINQDSPYFIPVDFQDFFDRNLPDSDISNLVVIDTESVSPSKDILSYQTFALLTADSLVIHGNQNDIRVFPLSQLSPSDTTINQTKYKSFLDKITPYMKHITPIITALAMIFWIIILPLSKLFHLLVFAVLATLLSRMVKPKLSYRQTFQIGLHAFALPTLIQQVTQIFTPRIPIPFFYSLVFLVFFLVILSKLEVKKISKD